MDPNSHDRLHPSIPGFGLLPTTDLAYRLDLCQCLRSCRAWFHATVRGETRGLQSEPHLRLALTGFRVSTIHPFDGQSAARHEQQYPQQ